MRKTYLVVLGSVIIAIGLAMLVLPGPGLLVIAVGLTVLASAGVLWAARLLIRTRERLPVPEASEKNEGLVGQAVSRIDERMEKLEAVEQVREQEKEANEEAWKEALVTSDADHIPGERSRENLQAQHGHDGHVF